MNRKELALLKRLGPCNEGLAWMRTKKTFREAWESCARSDWMLWGLRHIEFVDDKKMRLFACQCVRETTLSDGRKVWDLLVDERSRNAVVVAEKFARGEATNEEMAAAASAAASAYAAAYASAYAAAYDSAYAAAYASAYAAAYDSAYAAAYDSAYAAAYDSAAAAAAAAYDSAAYDSAAAAAAAAAKRAQADFLRTWISWEEVKVTITAYVAREAL